MRNYSSIFTHLCAALLLSCNAFKLDSDKNCLNQDSKCFKWDTTSPTFVSATPAPNTQVATLPTVTLVFSEELQNGTDVSSYALSGAGSTGLKISTAKYLGNFTYQLALSGSILSSGLIKIDFSTLKDFKNKQDNVISGQSSVQYQGNVSASVTASTNHNGLGTGGYPSITVTFQHDYSTSSKNTWQIRVTNGVESCVAGTQVDSSPASGPNQFLGANTQAVSAAIPVASFTLGTNRLVVCVQNQDNASVLVVWSAIIIRDDTAPLVSTATPISDSYGPGVQPFTVTCSDNAELIAVTTNSQTGSAPALPPAPAFDPTTGAITSGFAYTGPIAIPNPTNPTYTNYSWLCRDIAGHNYGSVQSRTYGVDINIPPVNVTLSGGYYSAVSSVAGSHANTTIAFTTDQVNPTQYKIIRGGTSCSDVAAINLIAPTALPATPLTTVTNNLPFGSFPTNGTAYDVRVCVRNALNTLWGPAYLQIWRDDTVPVFAGINTLVNPNDGTINLYWLPATDTGGSGVEFYEICQSTTAGACASTFTVNYQTSGAATSYQVTGLSTSTTYYFMVRARDFAGNREANVVEKKSRLSLTIAMAAGITGTFMAQEGSSSLTFTSNISQSFANVYTTGQAYSVSITGQPTGQNCAFVENQFGAIYADTTLNVKCVSGYLAGGALSATQPAKLSYRLYQGKNATVAGSSGTPGSANGTGAAATFSSPHSLIHLNGSLYVSDTNNLLIRRVVTSSNAVTTIAGSGAGAVGTAADDGACLSAKLGQPLGLTTDGTNLFVADYTFGRIRKLSDVGGTCQATTFAGTGAPGFADGPASTAQFNQPRQIVINQNYLFVADQSNNRIRRISLSSGVVDTLAGNGTPSDNTGTGTGASLNGPEALTLIANTLYTSTASNRIMSININTGVVSIVAGSGTSGYADGPGTEARFSSIASLTTDGYDLYVSEISNHLIRRVDLSQNNRVTTLAGGPGLAADTTATGPVARFNVPYGLATDGRLLYVANRGAHTVRKLSDNGLVGYWALAPGVNPNDYNSDLGATNNGTVISGPLGTNVDRYGTGNLASTFNGTNQYITATAPITASGACNVTMAAWFKTNSLAITQTIAYNGNSSTSGFGLNFSPANGLQILLGGSTTVPAAGGFFPTVGQWVHVAARCLAGSWAIFANGHKVSEAAASASATAPAGFLIGRDSGTAYVNGSVADVRVYNRALNEGEINELAQDASSAQVGQSYSSRATGLLSLYEFNNGAATTAGGPIGGLLTVTGAPTAVVGKDGDTSGAMNYSGAGQYHVGATVAGLPSGAAPRTHCAWVKPADYPGVIYVIMRYGDNGSPGGCSDLLMQDNAGTPAIAFGSCGSTAAEYTSVNYSLPLNTWSHVCGTLAAGNTVNIYVNGVSVVTTTGVTTNWQTNPPGMNLQIGNFNGAGGYAFKGAIDDVRIYDSALSAFQIRQLAVQIPAGLVARYDFNGDKADVSGFGQDLSNNGANLDVDRFGLANASARFTSSAYFDGAMNGFPLGATPRTVCAWTNPFTLFNGTFSEVVMYGNATNGWGFGMDAAGGLPNGRVFILDTAGDYVWNKPHGLNIWRHVCATYDGSAETLYVDAFPVASVARAINTGSGSLVIGKGIFGGGDYFNGNIDDVRIYNRALSIPEIQALLQQPNKRIFVTGMGYHGDLNGSYYWDGAPNSGAPTAATGIAGADAKCNWRAGDSAVPATGTYKAMVVDGVNRRACNGINCSPGGITDNIDWVLRSNLTYVRSDSKTPIFTTNNYTVFPFGTALNSVMTGSAGAWTGLSTGWQVANAGSDLDCSDWTSSSVAVTGAGGLTNSTSNSTLYNGTAACNSNYFLYCVEQ